MVQFQFGDNVTFCASIRDFCGSISKFYQLYDINCTVGTCNITIIPYWTCLSPSGVQLEFQWVDTRNHNTARYCNSNTLRVLGTGYTNSNGVAYINHTIDQTDLDLYNANSTSFELRVCIKNNPDTIPSALGEIRSATSFHSGDYITIAQNLCAAVTCNDQCFGYDLWKMKCDINTGNCIQDYQIEANSSICGYVPPGVNKYELYFKVPDIFPTWYVDSVLSTVYGVAVEAIKTLTDYYIEAVDFDHDTYIITIIIASYPILSPILSTPISNISTPISSLQIQTDSESHPRIYSMVAPIIAYILIWIISFIVLNLTFLLLATFFGKKETVEGQIPSTRVISVTAQTCTGDATTGQLTCVPLSDPNMVVSVKYNEGKVERIAEITTANPTLTISIPTNEDVVITASVKDNPYYTTYTETVDACEPGGQCPPTVPVVIKLKSQKDATANNPVKDTSGNFLAGKYKLFIRSTEGIMVEGAGGDLVNGRIPKTKVPADKPYCAVIYPSDYPTHNFTMTCFTPSAGSISDGDITLKTCQEEKNKISVRTVYTASDSSRIGFTTDKIEIKDGTVVVRTMNKDDPDITNRITSDVTIIDGLEKNKTYTVHVTAIGYTILSTYQDQQISYTTDCQTTTMIIVEANPPADTYDITIVVKNSVTLLPIQGANVTLDTMPVKITGADGSVLFTAVPRGTGHDLKIILTGYKDNISKIDITASTTITKYLEVDQVLATKDTRISNFGTIGDVIATKSVKFKGDLQYLDVTTYRPLTDAPIIVEVKDENGATLQTLSAITQTGIGIIGAGYFETGEWLVPNIVGTQISSTATFAGVGEYKSSTFSSTFVVAKAADCAIPIPFTNSCLLSKETGIGILMVGGLIVGGLLLYNIMGVMPKAKTTVTETRVIPKRMSSQEELATLEKRKISKIPEGEIVEIRPVRKGTTVV